MLEVVRYLRKESKTNDINVLRSNLYGNGINMYIEEDKILLSVSNKARHTFESKISQECNGLILNKSDFTPLMVAPKTMRTDTNTNIVNSHLYRGEYKIFKAIDGTYFNLYYDGMWHISTMNGISMNTTKWNTGRGSQKTFQDIITECLTVSWEDFTNQLDKKRCYSLIFRHPEIQKFLEGQSTFVNKLHFIQAFELKLYLDVYIDADSEEDKFTDLDPFTIFEIPQELKGHVELLEEITVTDIKELNKKARDSINDFIETNIPCYGFILRGRRITGFYSDIFIESTLMHTIKNIWYDYYFNNKCKDNKWNKERAALFNVYLEYESRDAFIYLFPQYKHVFTEFNDIYKNIIRAIIQIHNKKEVDNESYKSVAMDIINVFDQVVKFNREGKTDIEIIKVFSEFILDSASFDVLLSLSAGLLKI